MLKLPFISIQLFLDDLSINKGRVDNGWIKDTNSLLLLLRENKWFGVCLVRYIKSIGYDTYMYLIDMNTLGIVDKLYVGTYDLFISAGKYFGVIKVYSPNCLIHSFDVKKVNDSYSLYRV